MVEAARVAELLLQLKLIQRPQLLDQAGFFLYQHQRGLEPRFVFCSLLKDYLAPYVLADIAFPD